MTTRVQYIFLDFEILEMVTEIWQIRSLPDRASPPALQSFGATQTFVVGSALGTVGCVAASLVPTHQMPVEPPPL